MIDVSVEKRIYSPPPVRIKPPQPNPPDNVHEHIHGHGQYHGRHGQPANHPHFPDDHRQGRFPGDPGHFPEHTRGNGGNPMNTDYHPPTMDRGEPVYHGRNRHPSHENMPHPYRPAKPAMHPRDNFPPPPDVSYHSHGRGDPYHHSGHPVQPRFPDNPRDNPRDRYNQRYPPGHFPDDPYHRGPPSRGPPPGPPGRFPPSRDSDNRFRPY